MYKNNRGEYLWLLPFAIPLAISVWAAMRGSFVGLLLVGVVVSLLVLLTPVFRKSENVWTFVMIAMCYAPINFALVCRILFSGAFSYGWLINEILWAIICYYAFFSIEELVFGFFVRVIRKRQYSSDVE